MSASPDSETQIPAPAGETDLPQSSVIRTVCSHDCPDACSVLVEVRDGRVVRFRGDPDHPVTRGFLCGKVSAYEEVVNSPDRILTPLRRRGEKGAGDFEPISWDEAIETIATKIHSVRQEFGGEALLQYYYAGTMGNVHRFAGDALFDRLGATRVIQNICYYGAEAGYRAAVGGGYGLDIEDVPHSDLVIVWGANIVTTQVHLVPFIDEARSRGARLVVIDPYRNRTAARADTFIPVRPGTDALLAWRIARRLDELDLLDRTFIDESTSGYERFREEVLYSGNYSPEQEARITGIDDDTVDALARSIGEARAPLFKLGIGLGRSANGAEAARSICHLAGMVGAFGQRGGGVLYDSGGEFRFNLDPVRRPDWAAGERREVRMTDLHVALTEFDDPPVKFLYVHGANPAATNPELGRLEEGLGREDLFTVVHERFPNDTCRFADIVLPAPTFAETEDLYKSYGHLYLQMGRRAIEPRGECRSNLEVYQALGRALGFEEPWFSKSVEDLAREVLEASDHPNFSGIDVDDLLTGGPRRLAIPRGASSFRDGFPTPSGKLEFILSRPDLSDAPEIPRFRDDGFGDEEASDLPFRLITPPAHQFLNSSFCSSSRSVKREGFTPSVMIHPDDAASRGIVDGDPVELSNERGSVTIRARVTGETRPGVLVTEGTWWPGLGVGGRGINHLTSARLTEFGGGSTFHDNRVKLDTIAPLAPSEDLQT